MMFRLDKVPLLFHRLGLARWMPERFVILTTWGRKSNLPRRVVVDAIRTGGAVYVACSRGEATLWVKNLQSRPVATLQHGAQTWFMQARLVESDSEEEDVLSSLKRLSPVTYRRFRRDRSISDSAPAAGARSGRALFMRFEPGPATGPPPLDRDLCWLVPALALAMLALLMAAREVVGAC